MWVRGADVWVWVLQDDDAANTPWKQEKNRLRGRMLRRRRRAFAVQLRHPKHVATAAKRPQRPGTGGADGWLGGSERNTRKGGEESDEGRQNQRGAAGDATEWSTKSTI